MSKNYRIPFRHEAGRVAMMEYTPADDGEIRQAPTGTTWSYPDEWRDVTEFDAELEVFDHWKGRSAVRVGVRNAANGEEYSMGFHAFFEVIKRLKNGKVKGRWTFRKQGANYGVIAVGK